MGRIAPMSQTMSSKSQLRLSTPPLQSPPPRNHRARLRDSALAVDKPQTHLSHHRGPKLEFDRAQISLCVPTHHWPSPLKGNTQTRRRWRRPRRCLSTGAGLSCSRPMVVAATRKTATARARRNWYLIGDQNLAAARPPPPLARRVSRWPALLFVACFAAHLFCSRFRSARRDHGQTLLHLPAAGPSAAQLGPARFIDDGLNLGTLNDCNANKRSK